MVAVSSDRLTELTADIEAVHESADGLRRTLIGAGLAILLMAATCVVFLEAEGDQTEVNVMLIEPDDVS